ncbi:MAG: hypothetical protein ACJ75J_12870 [Cytophagaceae bacterium]
MTRRHIAVHTLFFLMLISASLPLYAQKVDFEKVNYIYKRPPQTPFPKGIRTYSINLNPGTVSFSGKGHNFNGYSLEQALTQYLLVDGYERILPGSDIVPDVLLDFSFSQINLVKETVNSNTKTSSGKQEINYHMDLVYTCPLILKIKDSKGNVLQAVTLVSSGAEQKLRYPQQSFNDFKDKAQMQSSFSNSTFGSYANNHLRDIALKEGSSYIQNHLAYAEVKEAINLPYVESNKFDFPQLDSSHIYLMKAFQLVNSKASPDQIKTLLNRVLVLSKSLGNQYNPSLSAEQKVTKKISGVCDYNAAIAYMLLGQYDPALEKLKSSHEKLGHGHWVSMKALIEDKKKRELINK